MEVDYVPVSCVFHERLEFAVLRRRPLALSWSDGQGDYRETIQPLDVATRDGAEWLQVARSDGTTTWVRLDRITAVDGLA